MTPTGQPKKTPPRKRASAKKTKLEEQKLAAEIVKIEAETEQIHKKDLLLDAELETANIELGSARRQDGWEQAAPEEHLVYTFADQVTHSSSTMAIHTLNQWSRRWPQQPITIIFSSPGGNVIDGLALYDFIQELKERGHVVTTEAFGWVASMGGILFQAGTVRLITKNTFMLIHEVSGFHIGNASQLEDDLKFTKALQARLLGILAERSTLTKRQIQNRWKRKDWWLGADEVLKWGFADGIKGT